MKRDGHCLCGAIKVRARITAPDIGACHCGQCRRWCGGSPYFSVRVSEVEIDGPFASFRASDWGERLHCATCGTPISWRMQGKRITNLAVGLFDDQSDLQVTEEIFVDRRAHWLPAWEGASQSTEADEFAKLDAFLAEQNS